MLTILLSLLTGLVSGAAGGGLVSLRLLQRARSIPVSQESIDPDIERQIKRAASQWATAHSQPAAAPLVAGKLRLAYALNLRRQRRHERRWTR